MTKTVISLAVHQVASFREQPSLPGQIFVRFHVINQLQSNMLTLALTPTSRRYGESSSPHLTLKLRTPLPESGHKRRGTSSHLLLDTTIGQTVTLSFIPAWLESPGPGCPTPLTKCTVITVNQEAQGLLVFEVQCTMCGFSCNFAGSMNSDFFLSN